MSTVSATMLDRPGRTVPQYRLVIPKDSFDGDDLASHSSTIFWRPDVPEHDPSETAGKHGEDQET